MHLLHGSSCSHASLFPECCRFSELHGFEKPNDMRALTLMDEAAKVGVQAKCAPTADREVPGDLTISAHTTGSAP